MVLANRISQPLAQVDLSLAYFAAVAGFFTRFSTVACSGAGLPSIIALQLVVMVSGPSNLIVTPCIWDSFFVSNVQHDASRSKVSDFASDAFNAISGLLPSIQ